MESEMKSETIINAVPNRAELLKEAFAVISELDDLQLKELVKRMCFVGRKAV